MAGRIEQRLEDLQGRKDNMVTIDELGIASEHFSVGASDATIPLPFLGQLQGNVQVRANLAHLADLPLGIELPPLRGMAEIDAVIGMRDGSLRAPLGALSGRGLESLLRRYTLPVRNAKDFSHLPIPFRAVATDKIGRAHV